MRRILFLTKCTLADKNIETKARNLGHEVFSSASILRGIQDNTITIDFVEQFHIVLLSVTIPSIDCAKLITSLKGHMRNIVRVSEAVQEGRKDELILHPEPLLEDLREMFNQCENQYKESKKSRKTNQDDFYYQVGYLLTNNEKKLLKELVTDINSVVTRNDLSQRIWHKKEVNNSTLSQISTLVGKIKKKMDAADIDGYRLETVWGKGYILKAS